MLNGKNPIEDDTLTKKEEEGVTAEAKCLSGREEMGSRRQGQKLTINRKRDTYCTVTEEKRKDGVLIQTFLKGAR